MKRALLTIMALLLFLACSSGCRKQEKPITTLDDAKTARIGVMIGTTGEQITKERFPRAQVKSFDDVMDAVAAMKSGQLEAIVTAYPTALQVAKLNREFTFLKQEPLSNEDSSIALRKGEEQLLADLNRVIAELQADGTLAAMKKRWFKDDLSPYQEPDLPLPTAGKPLKIGVCATREPLSFVDKSGRISGHDGELARWVSIRLNRPIEFLNMKFMALIPALQSGKIDLIISGMTATAERKKTVNFTQPYFANAQVMLVRKPGVTPPASQSGATKLSSADDLKDKRIGVLLGSVHDTYATKQYPRATVLQYKSPSDLVLAVKSGKVDAAFYTHETLLEVLRQDPELALLGKPLFSVPIGVGFNKTNDTLRTQFNSFLKQIRGSGLFNDMVTRWILQGSTRMPKVDGAKSKGRLVIGIVSDKGMPFTIMKDNRMIGFDVELAERFAAWLGKEPVFADMEFGSLIAAASTNKIDAIFSTLMITDERKKQVAFSDPYYELGASVFALKKNIAESAIKSDSPKVVTPSFFSDLVTSFQSNIIHERRYLLILDGLKTTVVISVFATLFGTLLGALICFMRMAKSRLLSAPARLYIAILRGTPVLVLLMLIFYVVFASININPVIVAVIAFGMNFGAYTAEIFRTGIEGVEKGQTEAGISLGFTRTSTFLHIVLPQMVRRILPVYKGEFISLVKMTSIVGYIAVQDLTKASDIIRSRTFDAFFPLVMVAILYFLISWTLMQSLEYLERITDPKYKKRKAGRA
ncbi:ABC transporter permease subunit [Trichlorobacter lovleyi]|uniref:Polar amino acid ABC transporter, inner membrane subunit n=2 Tax=Trichlorobacter lovleyi TaxID=313985 RepID=B3E4C5_TRIL1|nr:ABC transporter permease subunit [Trichlorobacter lovleyi]ACD94440.1 polar amino acid ABC transporter, inner membrane subunit [Trichlorobacter lovleyi SZ]